MKKVLIMLILIAVLILAIIQFASASEKFYGKLTGQWAKIAADYGFRSEAAITAIKNLPTDKQAISNMKLLVYTNNNELEMKRKPRIHDINKMLAYSENPIVSAFIPDLSKLVWQTKP